MKYFIVRPIEFDTCINNWLTQKLFLIKFSSREELEEHIKTNRPFMFRKYEIREVVPVPIEEFFE